MTEDEFIVGLCEDCTALEAKIEYDPFTDSLIGISAPLDPETGLPTPNCFPATSLKLVNTFLDEHRPAKNVMAMLAVPLTDKAPPYVLAVYPTDNKYDHHQLRTK